jgi:antitoxin component YwqK of YwqJK toxin-antitoxin module
MSLRIKLSEFDIMYLDGGGVPILDYNGQPFTGIVFENHKDGITLAWEKEYEKGYQEGWCRSFYPSGKKHLEYKTHNNTEIDGTFKKWDENGILILSY